MSASAAHGEHASHSKFGYYVGVLFRLGLDAGFTLVVLNFLWKLGTIRNWWTWPTEYAVEGWAKVALPARHLNLDGVVDAIGDNLWSWATLAFPVSIAIAAVIAFVALAVFKEILPWLGLGTACVSGSLMFWFTACWGFQILGPLLPVAIVALIGVAVVIGGVYWLLKFLWGLAKENAH